MPSTVSGAEAGVDPAIAPLQLCRLPASLGERARAGRGHHRPNGRGQRLRQFGKPSAERYDVRKPAKIASAAFDAVARQRHIGAGEARRARQQIGAADVGKEADADFRQGDGRTLGDDPVRRVRREADAAAHDQAIHHRDERLRITRNQRVRDNIPPPRIAPAAYRPTLPHHKARGCRRRRTAHARRRRRAARRRRPDRPPTRAAARSW